MLIIKKQGSDTFTCKETIGPKRKTRDILSLTTFAYIFNVFYQKSMHFKQKRKQIISRIGNRFYPHITSVANETVV